MMYSFLLESPGLFVLLANDSLLQKDLGTKLRVPSIPLSKCLSPRWRKGQHAEDPSVRMHSAPGGLCSSEAVTDLARPVWPVSIPSCQWKARLGGSALCGLFQPGLSLPGCVPVVVEDLGGSTVMESSPLPWFLPSPALSPFQIC